jgi:fluoroquinolone resistance protein
VSGAFFIVDNTTVAYIKSMNTLPIEDKTFENIDYSENGLTKGEYENCIFVNCIFSNTDLSNTNFSGCHFSGCNLSMTKLSETAIRDVHFKDCKLLGLHLNKCSEFLFSADFDNCLLKLSSFYKMSIKKTRFKNCSLQEVDFTECDLSGSIFEHCDLTRSVFNRTVLEKVDFRTSYNYSIDPEINRMKKAKFSLVGITGLLDKYDIVVE